MSLYYAGLNPSSFYRGKCTLEKFQAIPLPNVTGVHIDWNYLLVWRYNGLWITGTIGDPDCPVPEEPKKLEIFGNAAGRYVSAIGSSDSVTILTENNEIWRYMIYEDTWTRIPRFIPKNDDKVAEKIVKIDGRKTVVALTNLGRVFIAPSLVETPKKIKFTDISCGIEHSLLLAENGDVFSMGLGTRGQLGHGDLEDSDEPKLIEALAGLEVSQISAAGWCNAVVTKDADLYVWGWSNEDQMGFNDDRKVIAVPTPVDFKDQSGEILELKIVKAQCTSSHIVCLTDTGDLWGCGSNKYGQLGQDRRKFPGTKMFVKLATGLEGKKITDVKCQARGTLLICDFESSPPR